MSLPAPRSNPNVQDIIITTSRGSTQAATETLPVSRATQVIQVYMATINQTCYSAPTYIHVPVYMRNMYYEQGLEWLFWKEVDLEV